MNINVVIISGRLAKPSDTKTLPSGAKVCNLSLAIERSYKNKDGQEAKEKCFVDVTVWGKEIERCEGLMEGELILVKGRLKSEKWIDKATGTEKWRMTVNAETTEVLGHDEIPAVVEKKLEYDWSKKIEGLPF